MPRQRLEPGEHGKISEWSHGGKHWAATYVRDSDGKRRRVERSSGKSAEDARRLLQRHLAKRRAPVTDAAVTTSTTLAQLFEMWLAAKQSEDGILPQTASGYRSIWTKNGAGALGALRITELPTSRANAHLQTVARSAPSQARGLRVILLGMFGLAVRFDALAVNPITETRVGRIERKAPRALAASELEQVRAAVRAYTAGSASGGPKPGRLLPALVDVLAATGGRPSEVLALRWRDVSLDSDPPTVTFGGTLVDHQRHAGQQLHRQERRKHGAAPHTVTLPTFGVDALRALRGGVDVDPDAPVFASRTGGWMSIANVRRALRAALPEGLLWVTPHSFRRSVATVVRDALGPAEAQQQLSHARLSTTETHYLERHTAGPDVRQPLERWFTGDSAGK